MASYTTAEYVTLLRTFSDHLALEPIVRDQLFEAVASAIERFGGRIDRPQVAVLFLVEPHPE